MIQVFDKRRRKNGKKIGYGRVNNILKTLLLIHQVTIYIIIDYIRRVCGEKVIKLYKGQTGRVELPLCVKRVTIK